MESGCMTVQVKMDPCPFCQGPPCVTAVDFITRAVVDDDRPQTEDFDEDYAAYVWCHECGAQGPEVDSCSLGTYEGMYDLTVADVVRVAIDRWNNKRADARSAFDAADRNGLNLFPQGAA